MAKDLARRARAQQVAVVDRVRPGEDRMQTQTRTVGRESAQGEMGAGLSNDEFREQFPSGYRWLSSFSNLFIAHHFPLTIGVLLRF
jgi:hypothetical protein